MRRPQQYRERLAKFLASSRLERLIVINAERVETAN